MVYPLGPFCKLIPTLVPPSATGPVYRPTGGAGPRPWPILNARLFCNCLLYPLRAVLTPAPEVLNTTSKRSSFMGPGTTAAGRVPLRQHGRPPAQDGPPDAEYGHSRDERSGGQRRRLSVWKKQPVSAYPAAAPAGIAEADHAPSREALFPSVQATPASAASPRRSDASRSALPSRRSPGAIPAPRVPAPSWRNTPGPAPGRGRQG